MTWFKGKYKKALRANNLIHDAIVMAVADKYIKEENLENNESGLQILARAINWAIPNLDYDFNDDLETISNKELREEIKKNENRIFKKGLDILNSNPHVEKLAGMYITYEIFLIDNLYPKNGEWRFPGVRRMKKFLFQSLENHPNPQSPDFKKIYKSTFEDFNKDFGKYGKFLKQETIDSLFSYIF